MEKREIDLTRDRLYGSENPKTFSEMVTLFATDPHGYNDWWDSEMRYAIRTLDCDQDKKDDHTVLVWKVRKEARKIRDPMEASAFAFKAVVAKQEEAFSCVCITALKVITSIINEHSL